MNLSTLTSTLKRLFSKRARRAWSGATRAHIEIRDLGPTELAEFARHVRLGFRTLARVHSVEVNPHTRRVVVAFEEDAYTLSELVQIVEHAELRAGAESAELFDEFWEHPADIETSERLWTGLAADLLGVAVGTALRLSPLPASRLAGTMASVLSIVRSTRARSIFDDRFGPLRSELAMSVAEGLAQGLAQRPGSALVEALNKASLLSEALARRRVWELREEELCAAAGEHAFEEIRREPRPRPLPRGPIEEYANRAWAVSLGGFAVSFLTTRSLQRAIAALYGGLPQPALLGRETFAAALGRELGRRQVLVLDPRALRRLDRVDCLVLQRDLVARDRFEIRTLSMVDGADPVRARQMIATLLDVQRPVEIHRQGEFVLGPLGALAVRVPETLSEQLPALAGRGGLVFGLVRAGQLEALAEVEMIAQTGIDELIAAAQEVDMRVVVASNDDSILQGLPADDTIPEGVDLARGIRRLQREGRTVLVVATGASRGLATADCAIGLTRQGEAPPWGAHVICRDDLSDVRFLIHACGQSRRIAKQSVNVALGAATLGALVSAGGLLPMSARRVLAVVNAGSMISMMNGIRGSMALVRRGLPPHRDRTPWYALDTEGVLYKLGTSRAGLGRRDVMQRRGRMPLVRSSVSELAEAVTDELFNPLAPLLAAGAGLSAAVGSFGDAGMVGGVVALNAFVGGVQRFRTERRIRELMRSARRRALVRRGGEELNVDSSELVRGDIVLLEAGDLVPADCRIIEAEGLEVDVSSMTGESLPVRKGPRACFAFHVADRTSMLFEGTALAAGRATAVVVAVGDETESRRGAVTSKRDTSRGGVERRLKSLIDLTGPIALGAGVSLIGAGLLRGRKLEDLVGSGVSLAVASVPEGLPLLATAAQLAAADRLSKQGALVRNPRSVEALGRVDVLCLDKTGTLTHGRIELSVISDGEDVSSALAPSELGRALLTLALRATPSRAQSAAHADPMDAALIRAGRRLNFDPKHERGFAKLSELAFEAGRGYQAVLGRTPNGQVLAVNGAPEVLLRYSRSVRRGGEILSLDAARVEALLLEANRLGARGLRVLAVCERGFSADDLPDLEQLSDLVFLGFVAFSDQVRDNAAQAVSDLRAAGVDTLMLTGDHPSTAQSVANEVGIARGRTLLTGSELSSLSDDELDSRIANIGVFARVTPAQKVRIVRALQRAGRVVGMVGDGANDAPAIRLANVGIAVGERSTSAARAAADIILTDERIGTLVLAVIEGRAMWASVRDAVSILVGGNLGEIGFTLGAGLIDGRPPLNARQLLLVNLLTDVAPAMAIALRPPSLQTLQSLVQEGPEASLGKPLNRDIAARAIVTGLGASVAWTIGRVTGGRERANTIGLLALVGTQLGQTLGSARKSRAVVVTSLTSAAVLATIVQTPGLSQLFGCRPLGPLAWATAIGSSAAATYAGKSVSSTLGKILERVRRAQPVSAEDLLGIVPNEPR